MLRVLWVFIGLLLGTGMAGAQTGPSALARPVRPQPTDAPLAQVLAELSRQSGVPFSYSSTRIGAGRRCRLRGGPPRPLGAVLHELTGPHRLSYGLLNGQLVLWPATEAPPTGIAELNGLGRQNAAAFRPAPAAIEPARAGARRAAPGQLASSPAIPRLPSKPEAAPGTSEPGKTGKLTAPDAPAAAPANRPPAGGRSLAMASRPASPADRKKKDAASAGSASSATRRVLPAGETGRAARPVPRSFPSRAPEAAPAARASRRAAALPIAPLSLRKVLGVDTAAAEGALPRALPGPSLPEPPPPRRVALSRRPAQVSFVPWLGSNWLASGRTVNDYSLNLLGGYSAGVRRLELAGIVNVVRDTVRGVQAAGIVNVTGTDVRGVQLAGIANIGGGGVRGVQGAGIVNIVRDDARGVQLAGIVNISGGAGQARGRPGQPPRLRRWLGVPRLLATDPLGQLPAAPSDNQPGVLVQAAAIANVTGTDVRGLQTASILNVARRVKGAQLGLINVGKHVSGAQIGLVNFADSVDGVSIGIINIVRHGYLHGEVWTSECLPLNATLKLGVRRYYTLLGVAAEPFGNRVQWASGFGIGTAGRPRGRLTFSLDLMQWTLAGTSDDTESESIDTRLLTQLRPALAWQLEREGRLQLVVAPTLNLAIAWSNDQQPQWDFGANQWLWLDAAGSQSRTRLWPGLQVGLRF